MMLIGSRAEAAQVSKKPQLPVSVTITPSQQGAVAASMKPNDLVRFTVSAGVMTAVDELQLEITAGDGMEIVSGERSWRGPIAKGVPRTIDLMVRVPASGNGKITVESVFYKDGMVFMKRTAQYDLGAEKERLRTKPVCKTRKDSKGRDIIEYE